MTNTTTKTGPQQNHRFHIFLAVLCALCALATVAGLWGVYRLVCAYDRSTPEHCVRETLVQFQKKDFSALREASGLRLSEFEGESALESRLAALLTGPWSEIDFLRKSNGEYTIVSTNVRLATLKLRSLPAAGALDFGGWEREQLSLAIRPLPALELLVPAGVDAVSLNGRALGAEYLVDKALPVKEYGTLPAGIPPAQGSRYRVEGLFCEPMVEAVSELGTVSVHRDGSKAVLILQPNPALVAELTPLVIDGAKRYANYITQDATFEQVRPYFLEGTEFYTHLKQFFNGWYSTHDSNSFSNIAVGDFSMTDREHLSCSISFDYTIQMGARVFDYPSQYQIYLVKTAGGWKICNLLVQ